MKKLPFILIPALLLAGCSENQVKVTLKNRLPFDRTAETTEILITDIMAILTGYAPTELVVTDRNGTEVPSQLINAGQPAPQSLIFQADVKANSSAVYFISGGTPSGYPSKTYGRFVPERYDDYTWENDRIAFRIYGPALIAKDGPSNGLDVWIKRTDQMIIDKWYSEYLAGISSYNDDKGEGCDCYKVGRTLGAGAMAPFVDDSLWFGINFESWQTLDNGPLRTSFRLTYPPFVVRNEMVKETRTFSLDAGSQLNRVTEEYSGLGQDFTVAAGIVKRTEGNQLPIPPEANAIAYRLDGGEVGITYLGTVLTTQASAVTENSDHILIVTKCTPGTPLVYYTGAGWSKGGFETDEAWSDYVIRFSEKISSPLEVSLR